MISVRLLKIIDNLGSDRFTIGREYQGFINDEGDVESVDDFGDDTLIYLGEYEVVDAD